MTSEEPIGLLYLLSVGKEQEMALRVYGQMPTEDDLVGWMRDGVVRGIQVAGHDSTETSSLVVNFAHVVSARITPYSGSRTSSF